MAPTVVEHVDRTLEHPALRPPPPVHPPTGPPPGGVTTGYPPPPRDPTVVRTGREKGRRRLVAGGMVLVVGIVAVVVALVEQGSPASRTVDDPAGIIYDVPDGWSVDDSQPPEVRLFEDGVTMATVRHQPSDGRDAAAQLDDADPDVCEDRAGDGPEQSIPGAEQTAMCTNTSENLPLLALGAVAEGDGELWVITVNRATTAAERDELLGSIKLHAPTP